MVAERNAEVRLTPAFADEALDCCRIARSVAGGQVLSYETFVGGPLKEGVLDGDLILQGDGDPSLDDHSLWSLAAQLKGAGLTSVQGPARRQCARRSAR